MSEKISYQLRAKSDEFWETIKEDISCRERGPQKQYIHAPRQGRETMPARNALERIRWEWKVLDGCVAPPITSVSFPHTFF